MDQLRENEQYLQTKEAFEKAPTVCGEVFFLFNKQSSNLYQCCFCNSKNTNAYWFKDGIGTKKYIICNDLCYPAI